jgi:hypothetical protein
MEVLESVSWVAVGFASMFLAMEAAWRMARTRKADVIAGRMV